MTLIKLGELVQLGPSDIQSYESVMSDSQINERFTKFATSLKRIAPKANDFLYFSSVMMTAAEASLLNKDGSLKKLADGTPVNAHWDIGKNGGWKWVCNDPSIMPYKNNNGDIFSEGELLKSYRNFVEKPLCVDHRSSSVDAVRGVILDTYYDRKMKRIIGLCALDKVSYPELARKVATGYSTCVSIGVGVAAAHCFSCQAVATCEPEFCQHMKSKSSYGEINVGLSPIELSIVVNGADPQAKIRTIIAAANSLNEKLAETEQNLSILSDTEQKEKVRELESTLKQANEKLEELKDAINSTETAPIQEPAYGQSSGRLNDPTDETDPNAQTLNFPTRLAHNEVLLQELNQLKLSIEGRLTNVERLLLTNKEETMTDQINKEGYWQGAGGVNEPTPGKVKYPKDPLNEKLRLHEDRQMVGQSPFPGVGAVDGMHPSPASAEPKDELERKKLLQRASRRADALKVAKENIATKKEAYWQGAGGVNEPTPGKVKYPKDPLNEKLRLHDDKQMVGQSPFPGVGAVDGMHPSPGSAEPKDELARKKLLQRASYKAKFVRLANVDGTDNLGASGWRVYEKDEDGNTGPLVFTATVNELSNGNPDALFDVIATKDFGTKLLAKIGSVGVEQAKAIYKKAQANMGPGAAPSAPSAPAPDAGGAGPMPDMSAMPPANDNAAPPSDEKDEGGKGDPKEATMRLAEEARDTTSDLLEAVRKLTGEQSEMGDMEEGLSALPKAASDTLLPLNKMRKELNGALISAMKKSVAELKDHREELELVASILDSGTSENKEYVSSAIEDALTDAGKTIADAETLKQAYNKYINGTEGLMKRAEEAEEKSMSGDTNDVMDFGGDLNDHAMDGDVGPGDDLGLGIEEDDLDTDLDLGEEDGGEGDGHGDTIGIDDEDGGGSDFPVHDEGDINDTLVDLPPGTPIPNTPNQPKMAFDLTTKAGRAAYRVKLAKDATGKEDSSEVQSAEKVQFSDMLDQADRLANGQTKLEVKPSGDLGKVETLPEVNKRMLEVARMPPKVKKEAERLNQLITQGSVSEKDLDNLIAQGLDPEVVKYWRQFYGEMGSEGSAFAKQLTTETMKAKQAEEMTAYRIKVARAYELVNDMCKRGLCAEDRSAVKAQVDEVMNWNDAAFESMKRVVAKHEPKMSKQASHMPYVGILNDSETVMKPAMDLQSELDQAFSTKRNGY